MFELNSLLLGSGKSPGTNDNDANKGLQDSDKKQDNPFGAILDANLTDAGAAKSGKTLEQTGKETPHTKNAVELQKRTLNGGIELALGGVEPSQKVIVDYAKSQGLDVGLIEILMADGERVNAMAKGPLLNPSDMLAEPTEIIASSSDTTRNAASAQMESEIFRASIANFNFAQSDSSQANIGSSIAATDLPRIQSGVHAPLLAQGSRAEVMSPSKEVLPKMQSGVHAPLLAQGSRAEVMSPSKEVLPKMQSGVHAPLLTQGSRAEVMSSSEELLPTMKTEPHISTLSQLVRSQSMDSIDDLQSKLLKPNTFNKETIPNTPLAVTAPERIQAQKDSSIVTNHGSRDTSGMTISAPALEPRILATKPAQVLSSSVGILSKTATLTVNSVPSNPAIIVASERLLGQEEPSIASNDLQVIKSTVPSSATNEGSRPLAIKLAEAVSNLARTELKVEISESLNGAHKLSAKIGSKASVTIPAEKISSRNATSAPLITAELLTNKAIDGFRSEAGKSLENRVMPTSHPIPESVIKTDRVSIRSQMVGVPASTEAILAQMGRSSPSGDLSVAKPISIIIPTIQESHAQFTKPTQVKTTSSSTLVNIPSLKSSSVTNDQPITGRNILEVPIIQTHGSTIKSVISAAKPQGAEAISNSAMPEPRLQESEQVTLQRSNKIDDLEPVTLIIPTKISKQMKRLDTSSGAITKLAPISLPASALAIVTLDSQPRPVLVKDTEGLLRDLSSDLTAQTASSRANNSEKLTGDQTEDLGKQETLRRQDQYLDLSRRLTDALGQRLTAQINRGSWHVEMELHPRTLGRIEIQLEMKNGELEAQFNASRSATRDLIQEGLPRLRAELEQHGTESAYVGVGQQNQGNPDGKPTGSDQSGNEVESSNQPAEAQELTKLKPAYKQGLDIQV